MDIPIANNVLRENLSSASKEILTWRQTGVLPDGIVREVAKAYMDGDVSLTEWRVCHIALQKAAETPTT